MDVTFHGGHQYRTLIPNLYQEGKAYHSREPARGPARFAEDRSGRCGLHKLAVQLSKPKVHVGWALNMLLCPYFGGPCIYNVATCTFLARGHWDFVKLLIRGVVYIYIYI